MRKQIVTTLSAATLSVALGLTAAYAQAPEGGPQGAAPTAPAAQPSSPGGGNSPGGMTQRGEDAGPSAGAPDRQTDKKIGEHTKEPGATTDRDHKAARSDREPSGKSAESEGPGDRDRKSAESKKEIDRKSAKTENDERIDRDRKSAETRDKDRMDRDRKSAETGDGDRIERDHKGATVKIDADQKQKVRTYFSEHRPTAKRIDKSDVRVSIGIGIPAGIVLAPLPPDIVVVAADCPLQYFLWGDDVVLVDSCSREVVDIIPNIG